MLFEFDQAIAVRRSADGVYDAEIVDGWDIRGNANGGYVMAMIANAMREECERPDPVTITLHYLAPLPVGPVRIEARVDKRGRRLSTVSATLSQGGRVAVRAIAAFGNFDEMEHPLEYLAVSPPDLPEPNSCLKRASHGGIFPLVDRLDMRLHPDDAGFERGDKSGVALVRGWFRMPDDRPNDAFSVMLAGDAFPPPVLNLDGVMGWVPTIELTLHLRARPKDGWLRVRFESSVVRDGLCSEVGEVWDDERCVAEIRQIGLLPS